MRNKYRFTAVLLLSIAVCAYLLTSVYVKNQKTNDGGQFSVITSFYPMYIATKNVIGDCENISLQNLSEPQTGCLHDFQMTPEDMKLLSTADVFIVNGGGMESFLTDVAKQYPKLVIIETIHTQEYEDENTHAWMSVPHYRMQVETIAHGLGEVFPEYADTFKAHADEYDAKLADLQAQQQEILEYSSGKEIISFHESYEYLAEDYGMEIVYTMDLDEERQISAGEVADVLTAIAEHDVDIIFAEELYGRELAATVQKEADVEICYLDTLVRGDYDADSYIKGMQENIDILKKALGMEKP